MVVARGRVNLLPPGGHLSEVVVAGHLEAKTPFSHKEKVGPSGQTDRREFTV